MFININGLNIHYHVSGQGGDLVLLHGWGSSLDSYRGVHEHFEDRFKTYSLDFPGFGKTDEPNDPWCVDDYIDWLAAFFETMQIKTPVVMGHSFGGRLIIKGYPRFHFKKIILLDSAGIKPQRHADYYLRIYAYKFAKQLAKLKFLPKKYRQFIADYTNQAGSADYNAASDVMKRTLSLVVNEDLTHCLNDIAAPTLIIWGSEDDATPLTDGQLMDSRIPDSGLVVFEGAGHYAYVEELSRFLIIANSFLSEEATV